MEASSVITFFFFFFFFSLWHLVENNVGSEQLQILTHFD